MKPLSRAVQREKERKRKQERAVIQKGGKIPEDYKQLYAKKFDNLDEMDKFLARHKLPRKEKKTDHLNCLIKDIKIGNSLAVQWLGLRTFTAGVQGSIPGRGTKIPHAAQCGKTNKQTKNLSIKVASLENATKHLRRK